MKAKKNKKTAAKKTKAKKPATPPKKTKPVAKPASEDKVAKMAPKSNAAKVIADAKKAAPPKENEDEIMDRSALKAIVSQLKEMGSDIKALKSDTDEILQKKVNEALHAMPKEDVLKKLESIVPDKLVTILKRDCLGIFIDLSDISCVRCKDNVTCAREFLKNLKGGLADVTKALPDAVVEKEPEKAKLSPATRYEAKRLVFIRDVPNPNPVGDPMHDMLQAVLDESPDTMGELREIVERDFEIESDADFMKFVTSMRDPKEGIIKLDVDLSEKNKAELRAAGIDI